jgi:glycosyltransferase domain-containing protein
MDELITLLIPTYNRHQYLKRILEYYQDCSFHVIVADSSKNGYNSTTPQPRSFQYLHFPDISLTQKLETALNEVKTKYVVMCADDDFIIADRIFDCINFLENNKEYSAVQGNAISYKKEDLNGSKIGFSSLYENPVQEIVNDNLLERLKELFEAYRTTFSAVHYTDNLKFAFKSAGKVIQNLYLNEYLTAIIPVISGKYKELPFLYQVRESAEDSDGKTTDNLDKILHDEKYKNEFKNFIAFTANKMAALIKDDETKMQEELKNILQRFSQSPLLQRRTRISFKKRIGLLVQHIPIVGEQLIRKNRELEKALDMKKTLRSEHDKRCLSDIQTIIKKYSTETSI